MIRLTQEEVCLLHEMLVSETGGDPNLRDETLLNSALESAFQTFGGQELFGTIQEKAAKIGFSLIANHAFVDGNKRIGVLVMLVFLEINGIKLDLTDDDVIYLGLSTASGNMKYDDILDMIKNRSKHEN
ncbi:MAG: type II toxin-antitoxin system death-on-curing family toxin [Clostridia bacterium]|nr:type II toxin-antitoxin system death-on-curing family toxin [Clostridia bacterium]